MMTPVGEHAAWRATFASLIWTNSLFCSNVLVPKSPGLLIGKETRNTVTYLLPQRKYYF